MQVITELTWICPAKCPQCPLIQKKQDNIMDLKTYHKVLRFFSKIADRLNEDKSVVISGGEPSILMRLRSYVNVAHEEGYGVTIVTNGFNVENLIASEADLIELSIDYYGKKHDLHRGLPLWDKAEKILKEYPGEVVIRSTLFKDNLLDIIKIREWADSLRRETPVLVMPVRGQGKLPEEVVETVKGLDKNGIFLSDNCPAGLSSFVVTPELEVLPCIFYRKTLCMLNGFNDDELEVILAKGRELPRFPCMQ
ncbi:MAG: hypothetical protein QXJ72_07830 [Thermoproteota archaeon]